MTIIIFILYAKLVNIERWYYDGLYIGLSQQSNCLLRRGGILAEMEIHTMHAYNANSPWQMFFPEMFGLLLTYSYLCTNYRICREQKSNFK